VSIQLPGRYRNAITELHPNNPTLAVSSDGTIWTLRTPRGYVGTRWRKVKATPGGPWRHKYLAVFVYHPGNEQRNVAVHNLVLETFVSPPPNCKFKAYHENRDWRDCRLKNLFWELRKNDEHFR